MDKVKAYFDRIGLTLPEHIVCDGALLKKIQYAHCTTIPYENLDIIRNIPLSLEEDDLFEKIVINQANRLVRLSAPSREDLMKIQREDVEVV